MYSGLSASSITGQPEAGIRQHNVTGQGLADVTTTKILERKRSHSPEVIGSRKVQLLEDGSQKPSNKILTDKIIKMSQEGWDPIFSLISEAELDVNASIPESERTLLHEAAYQGKLEIVKQLIGLGADPTAKDSSSLNALHWGSMEGHLEIAQYLVEEQTLI